MSYIQRHEVSLTTDADGAVTGYTPVITGKLSQIRYVKTDFADGVTFAVTAEATGETLWSQAAVNASATVAPRQATHSTAGAAALYAGGGSAVLDKISLALDRVKIVVSAGGNVKTGTVHVVIE
jgi:hypothetical protein